jgi:hypothetical protein
LTSCAQIDHFLRIRPLKFHSWCEVFEDFGIFNFSSGFNIEGLSVTDFNKENLKLFLAKLFNPIEILNQYAKTIGDDLQCCLGSTSCNKQDGEIAFKESAAE